MATMREVNREAMLAMVPVTRTENAMHMRVALGEVTDPDTGLAVGNLAHGFGGAYILSMPGLVAYLLEPGDFVTPLAEHELEGSELLGERLVASLGEVTAALAAVTRGTGHDKAELIARAEKVLEDARSVKAEAAEKLAAAEKK